MAYRCSKGHPPERARQRKSGEWRCLGCEAESQKRKRARANEALRIVEAGGAAQPPPPPPDDVEIVEELRDPLADTQESEPVVVDEGPESPRSGESGEPVYDAATVERPPPGGLPLEDLIEHRIKRFAAKSAHEAARALIPITLPDALPVGILHFGDPHLDDDGVDLGLVRAHVQLVQRTPGLYAANCGDTTNNWIGRLAALYGSQATTEAEAWQLAEWFIRGVGRRWLYILGGNHDLWSGAGDPLQWITRSAGALYQATEARIDLRFPGRAQGVRINARHDFPGRSIYNDAHGPMRWLIFNQRDHLAVGGHIHTSAHATLKASDSGITMHALRVASYKRHDEYARTGGFPDKHLSPCALTVIDPRKPDQHPDLLKVFWDPREGADYLTFLRGRARV